MKENKSLLVKELKEKLFNTEKWPHYNLLFDHITKIIDSIDPDCNTALIERCYIYGGFSIFSSLFQKNKLDIYDFIPPNSKDSERQNYQTDKLEFLPETRSNILKASKKITPKNFFKTISSISTYDYIFIPNVLHHHPNPYELFKECHHLINKNGYLYIFDALLRENHQKPDDYIRFTTDGIKFALRESGFEIIEIFTSNSPLEALFYTLDQVNQYDLPAELKKEISKLSDTIKNKYKSSLLKNYNNLIRRYTSFPVAYSVLAQRQ